MIELITELNKSHIFLITGKLNLSVHFEKITDVPEHEVLTECARLLRPFFISLQ